MLNKSIILLAIVISAVTLAAAVSANDSGPVEFVLEKESFSYYGSPVVADADNDGQNELLSRVSLWFESCGSGCEVVKYDWSNCYGQTYCPTWRAGIPIEQSRDVVIAVGNLDSDPDNELVIANTNPHDINSDGRLTIWKHRGGDDFDSCWSMTVGEHIGGLAIGDCDNDGENELVVAYTFYWRGFKIYERVGECQYEESFSHYNGKDNFSVTIADCDNDDSLEIVITPSVWGTSACVWEYRDATYQEVWSYSLDSGSPYTLGAVGTVGDTDNDGDNEILVATYGNGDQSARGTYIFEHTVGDSYELDWSETGPEKGSHNPFIADILNDGDNEFLFVRGEQLLVYSYIGSGYDTLVVQQLPDATYGTGLNAVYVGDADNDGNNEVFISGNTLLAYEGNGTDILPEKESFSYYGSPVVADADNDGQNELLSRVSLWFESCGSGCEVVKYDWSNCYGQTYCPTWRAGIPIEQSRDVVIAVGNLDSDPDNELVIANTNPHDINSDGRLTIWKHRGGDDFDSCWSMTVGEHIGGLAIGDCDNDGENELVVAYTFYWRGFKIYERVGECQYEESFSHYNGKDNFSVTIADCDNDDSLEIVITPSVWGTSACVWEYRDATYQEVWSYSLDSGSPYTLGAVGTVGDTDNDGDNEILVATYGNGDQSARGTYIFEHTVGDSYELDWSETGPEKGSHNPFIADILNDGDNEFLFVRGEQLLVYSYIGSGYDTLVVQQLPDATYGTGLNAVYVGDADNDGNNEVFISGNTLLAYEGNGPGVDTLFISTNSVCLAPDLMKVALNVHNLEDTLSAMTIPLHYETDCPGFAIDSVSFWGSRIGDWEGKSVAINGDTVVLGLIADMGGGTPPLPPGEGPIAYIYFSIPCDPENVYDSCFIAWDTTTVQPENQGLLFVDNHANEFVPYFEPGTTFVALYRPGDVNGNCVINVGDVVYLISYLFKGGPEPRPPDAGDVNGDCVIDIGDVVRMVNYLYKFGPPPVCGCASHPELAGNCHGCLGSFSLRKTAGPAEIGVATSGITAKGRQAAVVDGSFGVDVAGVQLEFSYDPDEIQSIIPELTDRTKDLSLFFSASNGILKIGIVDLAGKHLIPAGDGSLVKLCITGSDLGSLELQKAILVDEKATPFEVIIVPKEPIEAAQPSGFALGRNYPNPFNPVTSIQYAVGSNQIPVHTTLRIYNIRGQLVRTLVDEPKMTGSYEVIWDGKDEAGAEVASGVYFYKLKAGEYTESQKMILMK